MIAVRKAIVAQFFLFLMVVSLLLGWLLLTGLSDQESAGKNIIRILAVAFGLGSLSLNGKVREPSQHLFLLLLVCSVYAINKNVLSINFVFIIFYAYILSHFSRRECARVIFLAALVACVYHGYLVFFGKLELVTSLIGDRIRYLFGFVNPNQLSGLYLSFALSAFFLIIEFRSRFVLILSCLVIVVSASMIFMADSRTGYMSIVFLILWLFANRMRSFRTNAHRILLLMLIGAILLTFYLSFGSVIGLGEMLSNRPEFFNAFVRARDAVELLFGWDNADNVTVDNAYLLLLSTLGLPFSILIVGLCVRWLRRCDARYAPVIGIMIIASMTESFMLRPELPGVAIFLAMAMPKRNAAVRTSENEPPSAMSA